MDALFRNVGKWGICGGIVFVWGFPQIPYVYGWLGAACTLPIVVGLCFFVLRDDT